jgi:hypothetical protein
MRVMLMAAAVLASGCSLVATKGPGNWTPESGRAPVCDASNGGPRTVDVLIAGAAIFSAVGVTTDRENIHWDSAARGAAAGGLALVAAGAIYSAVVGRGRVRECRAAHEDWRRTATQAAE